MFWWRRIFAGIWRSSGPLIVAVAESLGEFVILVLILRYSRRFVRWAAPDLISPEVVDWIHFIGFVVVYLGLIVSFALYAVTYGYKRYQGRARRLEARFEERLERVELKTQYNSAIVTAIQAMDANALFIDRDRALGALRITREGMGDAGR